MNRRNSSPPFTYLFSISRSLDEVLRHAPSDRQAIGDCMDVYYEISSLGIVSAQSGDKAAAAQAGLRLARSLLAANPKDFDAADYAGQFLTDLSQLDSMQGHWETALSEASEALSLAQRNASARPDNRDAQQRLATCYKRRGSAQQSLGHASDAAASFQKEIAVLEALQVRLPNDTIVRHTLMHAYARRAGGFGHPDNQNEHDKQVAFEAGRKMVEQAKFLYDADPADLRAMSDYGIALPQLALVTPPAGSAKRQTFEQSEELLSRAAVGEGRARGCDALLRNGDRHGRESSGAQTEPGLRPPGTSDRSTRTG